MAERYYATVEFAPKRKALVPTPGYRLDRYELLNSVVEGSLATLWAAQSHGEQGSEPRYAIQIVLPSRVTNARFRTLILDQANLATRIMHPNVVQVLEAGEHEGILYIVTERVDGCPLSDLRKALEADGRPMPMAALLRVMSDACAGLHAAHELRDDSGELVGMVHCDVCPQNILVGLDGAARISDMALGGARVTIAKETKDPLLKGDASYAAPELAAAKPFDRRADIWSLGAVLYELLGSRPPYVGENDRQTTKLVISGRPPPRLSDRVPREMEAIARRCLEFDPNARYQSAAELRNALTVAMRTLDLHPSAKDVVACLRTYVPHAFEEQISVHPVAAGADVQAGALDGAPGQGALAPNAANFFALGVPIEVGDDKPTTAMFVGDVDSNPTAAPVSAPEIHVEAAPPRIKHAVERLAAPVSAPEIHVEEHPPRIKHAVEQLAAPPGKPEREPSAPHPTEPLPQAAPLVQPSFDSPPSLSPQSVPPASEVALSIAARPGSESEQSPLSRGFDLRRNRMRWVVGAVLIGVVVFGAFAVKAFRDRQSAAVPALSASSLSGVGSAPTSIPSASVGDASAATSSPASAQPPSSASANPDASASAQPAKARPNAPSTGRHRGRGERSKAASTAETEWPPESSSASPASQGSSPSSTPTQAPASPASSIDDGL